MIDEKRVLVDGAEKNFRVGYLQGLSAAITALAERLTPEERNLLSVWEGNVLTGWVNGKVDPNAPRPQFPKLT